MNKSFLKTTAIMVTVFVWFLTSQLALAVETTATSSLAGSDPKAVLDGDSTTAWISEKNDPQEITVDLGYPWMIGSVGIYWGKNYSSEYAVQLTANGKTWKTVAHPTDFKINQKDKAWRKYKFTIHKIEPAVAARGLRVRCLKASKGFEVVDLRLNGQYPFCYEPVPPDAICLNKNADPEARVKDLLGRMTIREKIGMTSGIDTMFFSGLERFGFLPVYLNKNGMQLQPEAEIERSWGSCRAMQPSLNLLPAAEHEHSKATSFPCLVALAATWQPELAFAMGKAIGEECRADGTSVLLSPGVNIYRSSTCGRNFEYMGEDPYLASRMVVQHIKGVQSMKVIATIKHFIANNHEVVRGYYSANIDERALHEIYLPAFAAAVQEGNVRAFMSSYNWLNGEKCGESKTLLTDILRGELGYTGMVMSDWNGTEDQSKVLDSGQNMVMPKQETLFQNIRDRLEKDPAGARKRLDAMITPTLRVMFEMGIWDRKPPMDPAFKNTLAGHKTVNRTIAESAITLLKNDQVLPLTKGQSILITGDKQAVENGNSGRGSSYTEGYDHVNYYDGLKAVFGDAVTYDQKPSNAVVKKADRILYFFRNYDIEGQDRPLELPAKINQQIGELSAKNPHVIVVALSGTGFTTPWLDSVKGLVQSYYLGQEYGAAMANVLSGKATPSGKLPFTMEKSFEDSPANGYNLIEGKPYWSGRGKLPNGVDATHIFAVPYSEGVFVGYRWYEAKKKPVNFPFGFGLSYTTFEMSDLKVSANTITKETPVNVSVTVKNTGKAPGAEVVQLYVHDEEASVARPYRELKGFQKVFLQPGESKTVTITLDWKALTFWDIKTHAWLAEPGAFTLLVGNSSRNAQCQTPINYRELPGKGNK